MHLVCPECGTINRVADEHLDREPTCGQCKAELMTARPVAQQQLATSKEV
jgi:thioredoxin 2